MEVRGSRIWGGRPIEPTPTRRPSSTPSSTRAINFIDTANDYGRSEEYIGRYLSHRRDEYVLATKCGCTVVHRDDETDDTPHVWTRDNLFRGLHESLDRMKTDHVDVIQLHNPSVEEAEKGDLVAGAAGDEGPGQGALDRHLLDRPASRRPTSTGASSTSSRSPTPRWSGSTRTASGRPPTRARASSSAAASPAASRAPAWVRRTAGRVGEGQPRRAARGGREPHRRSCCVSPTATPG